MKYIEIYADTPYCGTRDEEYYACPDNITEEELEALAEDLGEDNAAAYEYLATDEIDEDDYATYDDYVTALENASAEYYENCCYGWKEITKEEYEENGGEEYGEN